MKMYLCAVLVLSLCAVTMCTTFSSGYFGTTNGAGSGILYLKPYFDSYGGCSNLSSNANYMSYDISFDASNASLYLIAWRDDSNTGLVDIFDILVYKADQFNASAPCEGVYNSLQSQTDVFANGFRGVGLAPVDFQVGTYKFIAYSTAGQYHNGNFAFNLFAMNSVVTADNSATAANNPVSSCSSYNSSLAHEFTVTQSGFYDLSCHSPNIPSYTPMSVNLYYSTNSSGVFESCNSSLLTDGSGYLVNVSLTAGVAYSVVCNAGSKNNSQIGLEIVPTRLFRIGTMQNYLVPVNGACNLPYISGAWGAELFFNQLNYLVFASTSAPGYSSFLQRIISVYAGENLGNSTAAPQSCGYVATGSSPGINGAALNTKYSVVISGLQPDNSYTNHGCLLFVLGGTNINGAVYTPTSSSGQSTTTATSGQSTTSKTSHSASSSGSGQTTSSSTSPNNSSPAVKLSSISNMMALWLVVFATCMYFQ